MDGNLAIGVYGSASQASTNWAGYFSGSVYCSGTYQGSDRKLKEDIQPLSDAMSIIKSLNPSVYHYKTEEYKQLHLPEGQQFGLIADEVRSVLPGMVKKTIQPTRYENGDRATGDIISEGTTFDAVNYTAVIPILIAALQELQKTIDELEEKLARIEK